MGSVSGGHDGTAGTYYSSEGSSFKEAPLQLLSTMRWTGAALVHKHARHLSHSNRSTHKTPPSNGVPQ
jgi:hypothetical protein